MNAGRHVRTLIPKVQLTQALPACARSPRALWTIYDRVARLAPALVPGAAVARGLFSPGVVVRSTLTFAVPLIPVPHPGILRSSVVVAFPVVTTPTLATAVESTSLAVVVVTSRLVLTFSRPAVPIVSGALIVVPPSVVLRLLPLHLAATKVVIPRATREAAPVFLIQITFMFDGVDPDGVFLPNPHVLG